MFEMEQVLGDEINRVVTGRPRPQEALENGNAAWARDHGEERLLSDAPPVAYEDVAPGLYLGAGKPLPFED
jgi:multiple sugar transport system substrate-binding protein